MPGLVLASAAFVVIQAVQRLPKLAKLCLDVRYLLFVIVEQKPKGCQEILVWSSSLSLSSDSIR